MLRHIELLLVTSLTAFSSFLFADQVTLKNGDRLTGTVVKSDGKTLVLHTDAAGDVTIQFDTIQEIKTDQQLHVTLKDGKTAVGPVTTTALKRHKLKPHIEAKQHDIPGLVAAIREFFAAKR